MTIYDSMSIDGVDFGIYMNSTCGLPHEDGSPVIPCSTSELDMHANAIPNNDGIDPDLFMSGVGRHKDKFFSQYTFFKRAANGTLPEVSWLMPPSEACDHPCRDVRQPTNFPIALVASLHRLMLAPLRAGRKGRALPKGHLRSVAQLSRVAKDAAPGRL